MYTILRKLHLYSGLVLLLFVMMYFVSGYVMIHHNWFGDPDPVVETREVALDLSDTEGIDEAAFSRRLQQQFDLRGKRLPAQRLNDGRWRFEYFHPGTLHQVFVAADRQRAEITTQKLSWQRVLIGLHRLHGYGGGWFYVLWAVIYDLASLSMVLFAVTGIYLWYKRTKKRRLGWVLLTLSWVYGIGTVLYLVLAK